MVKIAREGYPFIGFFAAATALSFIAGIAWLGALSLALTLFVLYFFRDPDRFTPPNPHAFYSPADGKVIRITTAKESEMLNEERLKISIFMSPLNVHVNRTPCDGLVRSVKHYPGKFYKAFTDDASILNEHITMLLDSEHQGQIVVKQIAGSVARRAVCRVKPGDTLIQGERYGIIKFSSRADIFLPLDTEVKVKLNDIVLAGETVLGLRKTGASDA